MNILEAIEVLNPATIQILSKEFSKAAKATRDGLDVGTVHVSETVAFDVSGELRTGEDYPQRIVAKANPWLLLQVALSHLNGTTIESITREALTADPALLEDLKAKAGAAIASLKADTVKTCKGKVTSADAAVLTILHAEEVVDAEDRLDLWDAEDRAARLQELNG